MEPRPRPPRLIVLAVIATAAALYFARGLFAPIVLALVLTAVLRPVVRALAAVRIPHPVGATAVVLGVLALLAAASLLLSRPAQQWARVGPESLAAAREKLEKLRGPVRQASRAAAELRQAVGEPAGQQRGKGTGEQGG